MSTGIVITGIGIVSPFGTSPDGFRDALVAGRTGVAPLTASGYSVSGCSGGGGVSSQGRGGVRLKCNVGTVATINDIMSLEVVEIRATIAVLRIKPAG